MTSAESVLKMRLVVCGYLHDIRPPSSRTHRRVATVLQRKGSMNVRRASGIIVSMGSKQLS